MALMEDGLQFSTYGVSWTSHYPSLLLRLGICFHCQGFLLTCQFESAVGNYFCDDNKSNQVWSSINSKVKLTQRLLAKWTRGRMGVVWFIALAFPMSTLYIQVTWVFCSLCPGSLWHMAVSYRWIMFLDDLRLDVLRFVVWKFLLSRYVFCVALVLHGGLHGVWQRLFLMSTLWILGSLGVLWFVAWMFLTADTPEQHPRITAAEKEYIQNSLKGHTQKQADSKVCIYIPLSALFSMSEGMYQHFCFSGDLVGDSSLSAQLGTK